MPRPGSADVPPRPPRVVRPAQIVVEAGRDGEDGLVVEGVVPVHTARTGTVILGEVAPLLPPPDTNVARLVGPVRLVLHVTRHTVGPRAKTA